MMEDKIIIRCLERDADLVQEVIKDSVALYSQKVKDQLGEGKEIELTVDTDKYMIERKIEDLSGIDMKDLNEEHENLIKINKHEDDKKW